MKIRYVKHANYFLLLLLYLTSYQQQNLSSLKPSFIEYNHNMISMQFLGVDMSLSPSNFLFSIISCTNPPLLFSYWGA